MQQSSVHFILHMAGNGKDIRDDNENVGRSIYDSEESAPSDLGRDVAHSGPSVRRRRFYE